MPAAKKPKKTSGPSSTDEIKAKFREALRHKEHHEGPGTDGPESAGGPVETHGPATTKRNTFRRKTG